ncbi:MAG: UDP-N-acetylmuramoyl-L-alanyl-D-glutamate--2,6-diaminopimelate ligase [Candidatus Eremiobacteraeota bacterium]|nr:UDP-N-acetylmuramoyl-L-alanyl-D-glutamate--2,6-diaminopimelate ligase [Candidatus Eremiobacteraeota bacterium]
MADGSVPLRRLISRLPDDTRVDGDLDACVVRAIAHDSRAVTPGALFVAVEGTQVDGHAFVLQAIANGASAVVVERPLDAPATAIIVQVADARRALSTLAAAFYGDPSRALDVVGVTGTNGKTTTVHMLAAILDAAGRPCGVIGTIGASFGQQTWKLENTTPLPPELHRLMAAMRDAGARSIAMEVSSHALALGRVDDLRFRVGALTNITRDHLDFHATIEEYARAKRRLFALADAAVLNAGDAYGECWARELSDGGVPVTTYGDRAGATLAIDDVVTTSGGSRFRLDGRPYDVHLPGRFNVENAAAAIGVALQLEIDPATIARGLAQVREIPGRMQRLREDGIEVVVDYAHTPDALDRALRALRETHGGRVAVVFGCGGDRDRGKRREMGATAARLADRLYVTSDNPRTEDPHAIAREIVRGIGGHRHVIELDRRRAIERAVAEARDGDAVLVAGKGHETYQIVGTSVLDFDDAAVAREALARRGVLQ